MSKTRVRYAPSPTGIPHIGNIRTALFNFLLARGQKGDFLLRIEDTDRRRFVPESVDKIKKSLKVLNLIWDEEYIQSERQPLYESSLAILKKKHLVYEDQGAWRFKVKGFGATKVAWKDLLHDQIEFKTDVLEDFVVVKSDGFPTYHLASVVDDHDLEISHVIRGDEWISSTPKHLLLYQAFSWAPPKFVHLPPILGSQRQKLSKREGARSVLEYLDDGYLPEAIVNFLALLGWSPKNDREIFTLQELIQEFSLEGLNKNSPIFNLEKLNWFNKKYLQKLTTEDLVKKIKNFSKKATPQGASFDSPGVSSDEKLSMIANLVRDRLTTLADFDKASVIFFKKGPLRAPPKEKVENAKEAVLSISQWDEKSIGKSLDAWIAQKNLEAADFKNTLRLAVFADNTPPIYPSLAILAREEVIRRIEDALNSLNRTPK